MNAIAVQDELIQKLRNFGDAVPGTLADAKPFAMCIEAAECIKGLRNYAMKLEGAIHLTVQILESDSIEYDDVRNILENCRAALAAARGESP